MSFITYNGITMSLIQTRRWEQVPLKVGQDIAGFRYTATVLANLNTLTLGPTVGGTLAGFVGAAAGGARARGLELWNTFRERLMAQRRPFTMAVGNIVIASQAGIPERGLPDVLLGPKPLACNAVQFNGGGSVLVEYTIQWAVPNPCPGQNGVLAVLAHTWGSDDDLDKDYFVTRTYRGRIQFDPRVAGPAGTIHPDTLRRAMFPPLAGPFRRDNIKARISEDGYTYDYVIRDVQPYQLVSSTAITRMEATHSVRHVVPGPAEYLTAASQVVGAAGSATGAQNLRGGLVQGLGALTTAGSAYWNLLPVAVHTFEATAYGADRTTYFELARAARVVCLWRLMKLTGVGITDPWGGEAETLNKSDPRATTFRMVINRRPRELQQWTTVPGGFNRQAFRLENQPATAEIWRKGNNTMPRITGAGVTEDTEIKTPTGVEIPAHIRQLVYGATPGYAPGDWNGSPPDDPLNFEEYTSFAPDLMTTRVTGPRVNLPWGSSGDGATNVFSLALMTALQDPCAYKTGVAFPIQTYFANAGALPGA